MTTASQLGALWFERDQKYGMRKFNGQFLPLEPDEEVAIRWWRRREVEELPLDEQSAALGVLSRWTPPTIRGR